MAGCGCGNRFQLHVFLFNFFFNVRIQVTKKIALSRENRDIHLLFKRENFYFLNFSLGTVLKDVLNFSQNVLTNDVLIKKMCTY